MFEDSLSFTPHIPVYHSGFYIAVITILTIIPYYVIRFAFGGINQTPSNAFRASLLLYLLRSRIFFVLHSPQIAFSIVPTFSVSFFLQTLTQATALKQSLPASSIFTNQAVGFLILICVLELFLFAGILAAIEYFSFWRQRRGALSARRNTHFSSLTPEAEDDDVRAERERVCNRVDNMHDVLEVRNVSKIFNTKHAVSSASFGVKMGECFGLLGPNGAGSFVRR